MEVPCDTPVRGPMALLRLHGRWPGSDVPDANATGPSYLAEQGYPLIYWGVTTECKGCDLPPVAAVVDRDDATCVLVDSRADLRLAGGGVQDLPGPAVTIPSKGRRGAVFDVWLAPWNSSSADNSTSSRYGAIDPGSSSSDSINALIVQPAQEQSPLAGQGADPPSGFAYLVVAATLLACIYLGPWGDLFRLPALLLYRKGRDALASGWAWLGATARASVAAGRAAVVAVREGAGRLWERASALGNRANSEGENGDEETGTLRRPLLSGEEGDKPAAGAKENEGKEGEGEGKEAPESDSDSGYDSSSSSDEESSSFDSDDSLLDDEDEESEEEEEPEEAEKEREAAAVAAATATAASAEERAERGEAQGAPQQDEEKEEEEQVGAAAGVAVALDTPQQEQPAAEEEEAAAPTPGAATAAAATTSSAPARAAAAASIFFASCAPTWRLFTLARPPPPPACVANLLGMSPLGPRFAPLDAFKGLALALWIFAENGGAGLGAFQPALWEGATAADVPFLWMALAGGFSLVYSSRGYRRVLDPRGRKRRLRTRRLCTALWRATARFLWLFLLGLFLNNGRDPRHWRLTGPLQSLAFAVWVVALCSTLLQHLHPPEHLFFDARSYHQLATSSACATGAAAVGVEGGEGAVEEAAGDEEGDDEEEDDDKGARRRRRSGLLSSSSSSQGEGTKAAAAAAKSNIAALASRAGASRRMVWGRAITLEAQQRQEEENLKKLEAEGLLAAAEPRAETEGSDEEEEEEEDEEEEEEQPQGEEEEQEAAAGEEEEAGAEDEVKDEKGEEENDGEQQATEAPEDDNKQEVVQQTEERRPRRFWQAWLLRKRGSSGSTTTKEAGAEEEGEGKPDAQTARRRLRWLPDVAWGVLAQHWREWPPALALLAGVWAVDLLTELPGCPRGYLGVGGRLFEGGAYWACTGAVHKVVDQSVLGLGHMDDGGATRQVYWTEAFDRYGVLNAFVTAAVVSLVGLTFGGRVCALVHPDKERAMGKPPRADGRLAGFWAGVGLSLMVLGILLDYAAGIPVVPAMMTPSFVAWAAGTGLVALSALYLLMGSPPPSTCLLAWWAARQKTPTPTPTTPPSPPPSEEEDEEEDVTAMAQRRLATDAPWPATALVCLGRNPLLVYAGHCLLRDRFPFGMASNGSLVEGLASGCLGVVAWAAVAYGLNRRGIFLRA